MKAFNLELALAGHPLITRDGREATNFDEDQSECILGFPYTATLLLDYEELEECFNEKGCLYAHEDSPYDLFMKEEPTQALTNVPEETMTLRDKFAIASIEIAHSVNCIRGHSYEECLARTAKMAYDMADAMMKARKQGELE